MSNARWNWKQKLSVFCALRIVPYYFDSYNKINILLGLDSKYKEWTPFGGTCDMKTKCVDFTSEEVYTCLNRELNEESKELLQLDPDFNFNNCSYMEYLVNFGNPVHTSVHNRVYFVEFTGMNNSLKRHKFLNNFRSTKRDLELQQQLKERRKKIKAYFEIEDVEFIQLNGKFREYVDNTYRADRPGNKKESKIDPYFFKGLIDSFNLEGIEIKNTNDLIDNLARKIRESRCQNNFF